MTDTIPNQIQCLHSLIIMNNLFTSSGYLESGLLETPDHGTIDFKTLPAFLRVLLSTDGTVTKSLESYFWERVKVESVMQEMAVLDHEAPYIGKEAGDSVLKRKVVLRGENSENIYTLASSLICVELLSPSLQQELKSGKVGVGELLRECGLETYREILDIGQEQDCVWRIYRIVMGHCPFIQIKERFPLDIY